MRRDVEQNLLHEQERDQGKPAERTQHGDNDADVEDYPSSDEQEESNVAKLSSVFFSNPRAEADRHES